jgi:hypothetical protein
LYVVSLSGGDPQRVARSFRGIRSPVWSPDGESLLFLGRSTADLPIADSFDWWWVKLDGSAPVKVGMLTDALRVAEAPPLAWTKDGVLFSDSRDLWSVDISPSTGRIVRPPRRLTVSSGAYTSAAASDDGRIVFTATQTVRVIERVALDASARPSPPVQLYADLWDDAGRPSETSDGSIIVFERPSSSGVEIWTKNTRSGLEQLITRVEAPSGLSSTISPDGTRIAYNADGYGNGGRGFVVETSRGVPSKVCDDCTVAGFLSDSRRLLITSGNTIRVADVTTGAMLDAVRGGTKGLNRPHVSPDGRWLAFRSGTKSFITRLSPGDPPPEDAWMMIDEPTDSGRPGGWSLDSRMAYLLLDTDGFRCLWGQRIDASGRLQGTPIPVRHFHGADWAALSTSFGNAVSPDGFLYATIRNRGNLWSLTRRSP